MINSSLYYLYQTEAIIMEYYNNHGALKKLLVLLAFALISITCHAQAINGTFQGEIEGISPIIIHLKGHSGLVEGFYKHAADSTVVMLAGKLDGAGNLSLAGMQTPDIVFSGRLSGKVIGGEVVLSRHTKPHPFYAVDLRGEYRDQHSSDYFLLALFEEGYALSSLNYPDKRELITTHRNENGRIGLRADSLNATMYLRGDTLVLDTLRGMPAFRPHTPWRSNDAGSLLFTVFDEFWSGESFTEFPEKNADLNPEGFRKELNDTLSVRLTQIPRSEYIVSGWTAPHERTYRVIRNFADAKDMLDKKLKPLQKYNESGEPLWMQTEIIYNDGTKKILDWGCDFNSGLDAYFAYYPELDILIVENEAAGDEVIDFNDSSSVYVGDPGQTATSPDGQWRITGYYPGGAADTSEWWMETWNPTLGKYERFMNFEEYCDHHTNTLHSFAIPRYINGWFWVDERTALFKTEFSETTYYKLELESARSGR